jgi:hypothetical protein
VRIELRSIGLALQRQACSPLRWLDAVVVEAVAM